MQATTYRNEALLFLYRVLEGHEHRPFLLAARNDVQDVLRPFGSRDNALAPLRTLGEYRTRQ
jgi:hypothetical protein